MTTQCSKYLNRIKNNFSYFQFFRLAFFVPLQWKFRGKSSSISTAMTQKWWFRIISNKHSISNKYFRFLLNQNDIWTPWKSPKWWFLYSQWLIECRWVQTLYFLFFPKVNSVKTADNTLFLYFKFFIQVKNKSCFIDVGLMTFWISSWTLML